MNDYDQKMFGERKPLPLPVEGRFRAFLSLFKAIWKGIPMAKMQPDTENTLRDAIAMALGDIRHSIDVSVADCLVDHWHWQDVEEKIVRLMKYAYARNHD